MNILGSTRNERIFLYNLLTLRKHSGHSDKWVIKVLELLFENMELIEMDVRIRHLVQKTDKTDPPRIE